MFCEYKHTKEAVLCKFYSQKFPTLCWGTSNIPIFVKSWEF